MDETIDLLRENIDRLLESLNWSRNELARRMGITSAMISNWFTGKNSPSLEKLILMAQTLGVSVSDLFSSSKTRPAPTHTLKDCLEAVNFALSGKAFRFQAEPVAAVHDPGIDKMISLYSSLDDADRLTALRDLEELVECARKAGNLPPTGKK